MIMTHEFCSIFIRTTVKQGRPLTHITKFNMSVQAVCWATAEGKKTFAKRYGFWSPKHSGVFAHPVHINGNFL